MINIVQRVKPQDFFVEVHIADIHFGVIDPETEYWILYKQFIEPISKMQILDIISVDGDLFDHKFMANSSAIMYAMYFAQELINICRTHNATLIFISGTGSHDADQMKLFYPFMKLDDVDVRVVMTTKFEYIKGKKILCIPEQYNMGSEYYSKFLFKSGLYDACYMHGTFKGAIFGKNEATLDSIREPVFDTQDFGNCLGPIISGHNHIYSTYANGDFFYCGSPIRWCFGEEQSKGFIVLFHNIKQRWFQVHFEPIHSFVYITIELGEIMKSDPNVIIQYIEQTKAKGIDYLRIKFTINDRDKIALLRSYYHNRRDITLENSFERSRKDEIESKLAAMDNENYEVMKAITGSNLTPEEKLVIYMNKQRGDSYWTLDLFNEFMNDLEKIGG